MEPLQTTAFLLKRKWRFTIGTYAPFLVLLGVLAVALANGARPGSGGDRDGASFFAVLALSFLFPTVIQLMGFGVRGVETPIEATPEALSTQGKVLLTRDQMSEGFLLERGPGRVRVRIVAKKGARDVNLLLDSREQALTILQTLRLDVRHRSLEVHGICSYNWRNIPARIVVGADGLLVTYAGFFAYGEIADVVREGSVVVVKRKAGPDLRLAAGTSTGALEERLREGLEAFRRGDEPADAASLVARRGRPVAEWMRAAMSLLTDRDYRTGSVTPDALWRIAEDPSAPPSARAGAATALRPTLDAQGRERLRAAASASAAPHIRVALEAAAEVDEAPLARALEQCRED